MMKAEFETALFRFLRTQIDPFTPKHALAAIGNAGKGYRQKDVKNFLQAIRLSFYDSATKMFVSRAGLFTNRYFSIAPTKFEIQAGIMIIGHRCMPFCDPEVLPQEINFVLASADDTEKNELSTRSSDTYYSRVNTGIKKIPFSIATAEAYNYYLLFGEEYVYQFLAMDNPQNNREFVKAGFDMPAIIQITVLEMKEIYKSCNFSYGDRISAQISNWDKSIVAITPVCHPKENPFYVDEASENRQKWFVDLENCFLSTFNRIGPCSAIEEQVAGAFFEGQKSLLTRDCASLEEFLQTTTKLAFADYGVESRLWYIDQEIPLMGAWNKIPEKSSAESAIFLDTGIPISEPIIEAFLRDSLYKKEDSCTAVIERIFPDIMDLPKKQASLLSVHVYVRRNLMEAEYNWFSDYETGKIRSGMLDLYLKVSRFICDLDVWKIDPEDLPQQSFVILSQLVGHITGLLDSLNNERLIDKDEEVSLYASLDGMQESFSDTKETIVEAVAIINKSKFSIVSRTDNDIKEGE